MKIVIFVSYTYPYLGSGIGQVALKQAEGLAGNGNEVTLVSSNVPITKVKFKRNGVFHIKLRAANFLDRFSIPVPFFVFNRDVVNKIKKSDIVHCHEMLYPYSVQAALLAKIYQKPFVLTQHAGFIKYSNNLINLLQSAVKATFGKLVLFLSDKIIIVNEEVKSWLGEKGNKLTTEINGVDSKIFRAVSEKKKILLRKKYSLPLDKKIALHVGRLVEKKGFKKLYDARSSKYLTVIVGGGEIPVEMTSDRERIIFMGAVSQTDLSYLYQASDVFILPSDCEGFPLSIQEAMSCGLPIITSKHPGFEKYLDKRYVKFIKPTVAGIKTGISEVLKSRKTYREMKKYSLTKSREYSWKKNIKSLQNIYLSLTQK